MREHLLVLAKVWFLTQMCARFSPQQVSHAVERGCGCARARESAVKSSIAQSTAACTGPAFGGGPARRQPVPPQGAEARAFTGQRTMNTRGTRPGLSPTFYRWAEPSLTVQPLGTGRPLVTDGLLVLAKVLPFCQGTQRPVLTEISTHTALRPDDPNRDCARDWTHVLLRGQLTRSTGGLRLSRHRLVRTC